MVVTCLEHFLTTTMSKALPFFGGGGIYGFIVSLNRYFTDAYGVGAGQELVISDPITCYVKNGIAPIKYTWTKVSGTTLGITGQGTATATFKYLFATTGIKSAVYKCHVKDSTGTPLEADSPEVSITLNFDL